MLTLDGKNMWEFMGYVNDSAKPDCLDFNGKQINFLEPKYWKVGTR